MQKNRHQKTETKRLRRCREICTVFFRSEGRLIAGTIRFFDLFSGIGGFREGLQRAGGFTCVGHCEADAYADHNYRVLFDTEGEWFCNDARNIETERMPDFDLLCAGLDVYKRQPYDRHPKDHKRQCVFAGSSNSLDFLPMDLSLIHI